MAIAASTPLSQATRIALAAVISLIIAESLQLRFANMAVWTTHMVMAKYEFTIFQRGVERLIGRIVGVLIGLILLAAFPDAWSIRAVLQIICLLGFFYLYFAGRLAYTFLNAGMYLVAIMSIGDRDPVLAFNAGPSILFAILVGVLTADMVIWLTRAETDTSVNLGHEPLLPIRWQWLNHALMLTVSAMLAVALTQWVSLPTEQALISVFIMAISPDILQDLQKGKLRLLGAIMALGWGLLTFAVVGRVPSLLVFAGLLFFGMLIAGYISRASVGYGYAGVQMGLALPMLVVVRPDELGNIDSLIARLEGIAAALLATLLVGGLWPPFSRPAATAS
jgi:uncharacterized membrane protein YccC